MYALFMKTQRVKFPWDLFWENKTYKLKRFIGGLSEDDGEGQRDRQKVIDLYEQNNNFASASRFFAHFFSLFTDPLFSLQSPSSARDKI